MYLGRRFGYHDIGIIVMDLGLFGFGDKDLGSWFLGVYYGFQHGFTVRRNFENISFFGSQVTGVLLATSGS